MNRKEREKLIADDVRSALLVMHKGGPLSDALTHIIELIRGIKYVEDKKFLFLLDGITQEKLEGKDLLEKDKQFIEGFNESAEESNFAIKLAKEVIKELEN